MYRYSTLQSCTDPIFRQLTRISCIANFDEGATASSYPSFNYAPMLQAFFFLSISPTLSRCSLCCSVTKQHKRTSYAWPVGSLLGYFVASLALHSLVHSPANAVLLSLVRLDCAFCPLTVTLLSRLDNQIATPSSAFLLGYIRRHVFPMPHFTDCRQFSIYSFFVELQYCACPRARANDVFDVFSCSPVGHMLQPHKNPLDGVSSAAEVPFIISCIP